jgi:hypothetical protein
VGAPKLTPVIVTENEAAAAAALGVTKISLDFECDETLNKDDCTEGVAVWDKNPSG